MATKIFLNSNKLQIPPGSLLHRVRLRTDYTPEQIKVLGLKSPTYVDIDGLYKYNEVAGIINLSRVYDKIEVEFTDTGFAQRDQFGKLISKEDVNRAAKNNQPFFSTKLEAQQESKISNEGTIIGDFKQVGGFKSLSPFAKEGEAISKRVMPVKLTSSVGDGSLSAIATNTSQLTSILGSNPAATGTLKRIVTSGAPASLLKQMQKSLPKLSPQKLRTFAANVSVSPSNSIEALKPEKNPSLVSVQAASKIYKDKLKLKLNSGGFDLNPLDRFPGMGRTKQNLAAQLVATLLNKVGSTFGNILNGLKVFGDNPPPSITSAFRGNVKDLIEVGGSQTNVSSYVNKGSLVNIETPKIQYLLQDRNAFLGYATTDDYEFPFVNSTEELIKEFQLSSRGPNSDGDDAIGGLFIHETRKFTGPPEKANAKAINDGVKKVQLKLLTKEIKDTNTASDGKTAAETALERISIKPNDYGLNSHYVILTDGSLQRGRPIDKTRTPTGYPRFYKTGLQLTFVSGGKIPNSKMFETYDRFLKAWFTVFPDCGVYGTSEVSNRTQNTFDVRQTAKSKFRFVYRYDDLSELNEFPNKVERAITKPTTIATTSSTITKPVTFAEANKNIKEVLESEEFNNDVDGAFNKAGAALAQLNGEERNAIATKFGAENLPQSDLKAKMDTDFKNAQSFMKEKNKQLNSIIGKTNTDNTSVKTFADKLRSK